MPFENFEKPPSFQLSKESEENWQLFENYLKERAERLQREGVPIDRDFRINPELFKGKLYSPKEVENDLEWVKEKKIEFGEKNPQGKRQGELLEKYIVALFNKHFDQEFIAVRTAEHDDFLGHADTLLVDKATGTPICAFDEVSAMRGPTYEEKRKKVLARNLIREGVKGGVTIKYGFTISQKEGREEIKLERLRNVPIFYLALSPEALEEGIKNFTPSKENTSSYEEKMMDYLLTSLSSQIAQLRLEEKNLSSEVLARINFTSEKLIQLEKERKKN